MRRLAAKLLLSHALVMRKEELERRAAEMRAKYQKRPMVGSPALKLPELPKVPPHTSLDGVWTREHENGLLEALGDVDPLVLKTARAIGHRSTGGDGLLELGGQGTLNTAASVRMLADALHLWAALLRGLTARGGTVKAAGRTLVTLPGAMLALRLREGYKVHSTASPNGTRTAEFVHTGQLWLSVEDELGTKMRLSASVNEGADPLLRRIDALVAQQAAIRDRTARAEKARQEERDRWAAEARLEREARTQADEHERQLDAVMQDVDRWTKAEHLRAYLAAYEARYCATNGPIVSASEADGWLRWLHLCADRMDPLVNTRHHGTAQSEAAKGDCLGC